MTQRDLVLEALSSSLHPLDDDELARRAGVSPRQAVNQVMRKLEREGVVRRVPGPDGKMVNDLLIRGGAARATTSRAELLATVSPPALAGDATEQRLAERHMLNALGERLGVHLEPRRLHHASGARVEIDGADDSLSVLVECWAHQGPAKPAQKSKLIVDATKLSWIAKSLDPAPARLILCLSDPAAMSHLAGRSWQAEAIRDLGVEIAIVELDPEVIVGLAAAQKRQYR
jgi:hypothetical protein